MPRFSVRRYENRWPVNCCLVSYYISSAGPTADTHEEGEESMTDDTFIEWVEGTEQQARARAVELKGREQMAVVQI